MREALPDLCNFPSTVEPKRFLEVTEFKPVEMQRSREGRELAPGHTAAVGQRPILIAVL